MCDFIFSPALRQCRPMLPPSRRARIASSGMTIELDELTFPSWRATPGPNYHPVLDATLKAPSRNSQSHVGGNRCSHLVWHPDLKRFHCDSTTRRSDPAQSRPGHSQGSTPKIASPGWVAQSEVDAETSKPSLAGNMARIDRSTDSDRWKSCLDPRMPPPAPPRTKACSRSKAFPPHRNIFIMRRDVVKSR